MALTEAQEKILDELVEYVENWRSSKGISLEGELNGDNLVNFVTELQIEIKSKVSMSGAEGQTLLLYTGSSAETGKWLWQEMSGFCVANPEYYYISSTDGGSILWETEFQEAIKMAIKDTEAATRILSGKSWDYERNSAGARIDQYAIEGTQLLALDDFISQTLTQNAVKNGNRVIYVAGQGWKSNSVGMQTEIPAFITDAWIGKSIDEALNIKLTIVSDLSEITDIDSQIISDVDLVKTEFCVDAEGKVIGVKLVSELDDISVGVFDDTGTIVTYGEKIGILSEVELRYKYNLPDDLPLADIEAFARFDYYKSAVARDITIKSTGIMLDPELRLKYSFLSDGSDAYINAYRNYEYLISVGANDDLIRATGILPDPDLKLKYTFLSNCKDPDVLNKFRNFEYISANNIATTTADILADTNIYLDADGKLLAMLEATSTEIPADYACKVTLGDASRFQLDDVMESTYPTYKDLSEVEKVRFKEYEYNTRCAKLHLDNISISDATMSKYLAAAGKTADQLNTVDMYFMKMADAITSGDVDTVKLISKLSDSCKGISKVAKVALPIIDAVGNIAVASISIYNAVKLYEAGYENEASAVMTGCAINVIGGIAGGAALTGAISPYLMGMGAVVGGPAGVAIGAVVSGVIGYGMAGITSFVAGELVRENWDAIVATIEDTCDAVNEGVHDLYGLVLAGFDADADGAYFKGTAEADTVYAGAGNLLQIRGKIFNMQ